MKFSTANKLRIILLLIALIMVIIGTSMKNLIIILIGGVIGLVSTIIWIIYGRCPHCRIYLGNHLNAHCPHCGEKLKK